MKNNFFEWMLMLALVLGFSSTVTAALIDRGNGMIYDSDQNLTWLQDASMSDFDAEDWHAAMSWVDNLNHGGFSDWRLPSADLTCASFSWISANTCTGNELGRLFVELGAPVDFGSSSSWGPFNDVQYFMYWSNTEYGSELASLFLIDVGVQIEFNKSFRAGYVWAVRSGDVTVAEPGALLLLLTGFAGMLTAKYRRRSPILV